MGDGRKAPWFAMDSEFYTLGLGQDILDEFGTVGQSVFVAFLAYCKTTTPEGQMKYSSDAQFLEKVGLDGVPLVDLEGNEWEMETFWTWLGHRKQVSRRRHRSGTKVTSTNWGKWQKSYRRANEAEQKRRSRGENTPDNSATEPGQSAVDAPTIPGPTSTSTSTNTSSSSIDSSEDPPGSPVEDEELIERVISAAARKLTADAVGVNNPPAYAASIAAQLAEYRGDVTRWATEWHDKSTGARLDEARLVTLVCARYRNEPAAGALLGFERVAS